MAAYGIPADPTLRTTSKLRVWLLHAFCGYKVLKTLEQPRSDLFGRLTYDKVYLLCPRENYDQ